LPIVFLILDHQDALVHDFSAFARTGQRPATIMDRIANGFSDDEVRAIAECTGRKNRLPAIHRA